MSKIAFDPSVPVMRRDALSFPKHLEARGDFDAAVYVPFSEACTTAIEFDAHVAAYSCPSIARRLGTSDALRHRPAMVLFIVDVDGPDHTCPPDWWAAEREKVRRLFKAKGWGYAYTTRGGYRIAYGLRDELTLTTPQDARRWTASYQSWLAILEREFDIHGDPACSDPFRLFRLPRVVRDGVATEPSEEIGWPSKMLGWREPYADIAAVEITMPSSPAPTDTPPLDDDRQLQAVEVLAKAWPSSGRHRAQLALAGALAKAGWLEDEIAEFVACVAETQQPGNADLAKRRASARDSLDRLARGEDVAGWGALAAIIGAEPVDAAKRILGMDERALFGKALAAVTPRAPSGAATAARELTLDEIEAHYRLQRQELARTDDVAARVDAKYLDRLKRKALHPLHDASEDAHSVERALATAMVRRAPGGASDCQLAALLEPRIGDRAAEVIAQARAAAATEPSVATAESDDRKSQATRLLEIVDQFEIEFFHDEQGVAYATVPAVRDPAVRVTYPIEGQAFRLWLERAYYEGTQGGAVSEPARHGVMSILRSKAIFEGETRAVFVRVGHLDGRVYLDLCHDTGRAVEVDAEGWRVIATSPVRFVRHRGMLPLPEPSKDGSFEPLWKYIRVAEADRLRVLAFQVSVFLPSHFYALALIGEPGSIKSAAARALRRIVDPNTADLRMSIGDPEDLLIAARKSWVQAYDNLKALSARESDALCCLTDGTGFSTRERFTNDDESLLVASRPVILTGVEDIVTASDLLDRSIRVECPRFHGRRLDESEVEAMFAADWPVILGALLTALSTGLRNVGAIGDVDRAEGIAWPRRKAAAKLACAAAPAFGATAGEVLRALTAAAHDDHLLVLEASPVANAIIAIASQGFTGTCQELLPKLASAAGVGFASKRPDGWPADATRLSGQLRKIAKALESIGVVVIAPGPTDRPKNWTITKKVRT